MFSPDALASLQDLCARHDRVLVISHLRPDGDAYGSTLGLALCLRAMGKDVVAVNADGLGPLFAFLPGADLLTVTPHQPPEQDRLGV
jgi:phosphoesterase RecJ-like protein